MMPANEHLQQQQFRMEQPTLDLQTTDTPAPYQSKKDAAAEAMRETYFKGRP
jgi:hypothetical protein